MTRLAPLHGRIAIIGSGIAGLMTALELAPEPVVVITRADLGGASSTAWAQGGIAAALGAEDDTDLHVADTLAAGDGLCDPDATRNILADTPGAIAALERHGVRFDRAPGGGYAFGLEAAHSRRRILHLGGDGTGAAITHALTEAVLCTPSITVLPGTEARRLIVEDGQVTGLMLQGEDGPAILHTIRVVMATGGIGGLYDATTNPRGNFGQGLAMAARAGAELADMEFVQFHPTALAVDRTPLPLVSEAVRGEGAVLIDASGHRFMADTPGAELAPRDVVARAIAAQIARGNQVFLDARAAIGPRFAAKFPEITRNCAEAGIDPATQPIPVRPAAHYHMGGIATDRSGRTSLPGLWAIGECAATGLHGANRLASNSLLEAAIMARRAAHHLSGQPAPAPKPRIWAEPQPVPSADPTLVRQITSAKLGMARDAHGLEAAIAQLLPLAQSDSPAADPAIVALAIATFATLRRESRGAHARTDFPQKSPHPASRRMTLDAILSTARRTLGADLLQSA